ncbi:MAG: hypothetical protein ABJV68_05210 [Paracoccaceae bacterium]
MTGTDWIFSLILNARGMIGHPGTIVGTMLMFSLVGGVAVKQFSETRDVLWIIAAYSLLSLSNVMWILAIDHNGIARTMILSSAIQIVLTTAIGYSFGEKLTGFHLAAMALVFGAAGLIFLGQSPTDGTAQLLQRDLKDEAESQTTPPNSNGAPK